MKILCPTDFSECSVNAIKWAIQLLELKGSGEIEILHCIDFRKRSDMFSRLETVLEKQALQDMKVLTEVLGKLLVKTKLSTKIVLADPKSYITNATQISNSDFIVIGSTGLTSLKDITIGSVTEYVAKNSEIPILVIPDKTTFKIPSKLVFGLDKQALKQKAALGIVQDFIESFRMDVKVGQVVNDDNYEIRIDDAYYEILGVTESSVQQLDRNGKISEVLHKFAKTEEADICAVVHHKLNWFNRLLHHSVTKDELFNLEIPLFIIPD